MARSSLNPPAEPRLDATMLVAPPLAGPGGPVAGWRLRTTQGRGEGALHGLRDGLRLGRVAGNDIVLGDRDASRHHARIDRDGEGFVIVDLGSLNGTRVNGKRIESRTPLKPGDRIAIGQAEFVVEAEPVVEDLAATRLGLEAPAPRREEPATRTEGQPRPSGEARPQRARKLSPPPPPSPVALPAAPRPSPAPPKAGTACSACGRVSRPGARFCAGCGRLLASGSPPPPGPAQRSERACASCAAPLRPRARFCGRCGGPART